MDKKKKILILDESGIMIRNCLGGLKHLSTEDGHTTGGVFGFVRTVLGTAARIQPDHIVCCADSSRDSLKRRDIFPAYKKNREGKKMEIPDYPWQKSSVRRFCEIIKAERVRMDGYEADDLIASVSHQYGKDHEVYILSGDKDFVQLITPTVKVILLGKFDNTDEFVIVDNMEGASNVLGVDPKYACDDQGIQGDAADNYPGILKVGKVSAKTMINKFGGLEEIYSNLDDPMFFTKKGDRNALYKNLTRTLTLEEQEKWGFDKLGITTNKQAGILSRTLAKLEENLPLNLELKDSNSMDIEELNEFFEELEFESLIV